MRPLRPLFRRHADAFALEREAENLRNRDWVELLKVVHPSQAAAAEREYVLSRLSADWATIAGALIATHSLPAAYDRGNLLVLCDHNTFANELSLIAPAVEKKILARYDIKLKIHARATKRIDWQRAPKDKSPPDAGRDISPTRTRSQNPALDGLILEISKLE